MIVVLLTSMKLVAVPLKRTAVALSKFVPVNTTVAPGKAAFGATLLMVGQFNTVNDCVWVAEQPVLLSVIGPLCAPLGTVTVICVPVPLMLGLLAAMFPPNTTLLTPRKPVPLMVKLLPGAPLVGLMLVTAGQAWVATKSSAR